MSFEPVLTKGIGVLDLNDIRVYESQGGYQALRKALKQMTPDEVREEVTRSNLRGRGGAGFPTGRKWSFLPNDGRPRYLVCNADESEPGTCNNRILIQWNPHQLIEGILLAAYAIGAAKSFIYIRGEFYRGYKSLMAAIEQARARGYIGENILGSGWSQEIVVHRGAGAYICGEESALLNSLEGKRGEPRLKPPFPAVVGLYGMPTIVNNVETLSCVPHIINRGAEWFASIGPASSPGPKIYSVSGLVRRPGNYELPMGVTLRELIFEHAGGMLPGRTFKAASPGGSSTPILVEQHLDTPLDFDSVRAAGSMLGTAGVIVYDNTVSMPKVAEYFSRFYAGESCGQCTPCREGTNWMYRIIRRMQAGGGQPVDLEVLRSMGTTMSGTTICPLADASLGFVLSAMKYFPEEFEALAGAPKEVRV
ncbi:MAG: NADH-quinone oxidoreductase subunit NuoF [Bacillota bacterium]|nr:MAG: NADH-quinone oxidoreductase subunit F [Bacillota bacterium]